MARSASETGSSLGSPAIVDAAEEVLARARSQGSGEEPWSPLTAREFEVARLVADGLTNPAIGVALGIAPKTVAAHISHILMKLDASRRAEIAAWTAAQPVLHSRPHGGDREE
jgi:DNA-binding CsgD family transcriptional regulator